MCHQEDPEIFLDLRTDAIATALKPVQINLTVFILSLHVHKLKKNFAKKKNPKPLIHIFVTNIR